jgi:hypothetical protein
LRSAAGPLWGSRRDLRSRPDASGRGCEAQEIRPDVSSRSTQPIEASPHRDTFRRRSGGQWWHEIGTAARSSPGAGAAADRATSSSSTTNSSETAGRPRTSYRRPPDRRSNLGPGL